MYPSLVLLAGGKSSRMKTPKGLLKYQENYWLLSQIENFIGNEVFIGLGYDYQAYFKAIPWLQNAVTSPVIYQEKKITVIINSSPEFGLFSTIKAVLQKINVKKELFVLPVDVPLFSKENQQQLIDNKSPITIPKFEHKNGHPIKLHSSFWKTLLTVDIKNNEARLDYQIKKEASITSYVDVTDASCILNLNTPKDWQLFIKH